MGKTWVYKAGFGMLALEIAEIEPGRLQLSIESPTTVTLLTVAPQEAGGIGTHLVNWAMAQQRRGRCDG